MTHSMTAYATGTGTQAEFSWQWDLRGVNAKGLDLRLRVPDWIDGLEAQIRAALTKSLGRGSIHLTLRVTNEGSDQALELDQSALKSVLLALAEVETAAHDAMVSLAPTSAADVLGFRGVLEGGQQSQDTASLGKALIADLGPIIDAFCKMRAAEGVSLQLVLLDHLSQIETLSKKAAALAEARKDKTAVSVQRALDTVLQNGREVDPNRLAQELALLAIKADITEEIDRLAAHVKAARDLLAEDIPVGRRLDFLAQEFNREANTLCSKSSDTELTAVGLELKALIEQMREQIQNVE
ncbi:YicC/YloC family endoribonuclease [Algirhabdus cladophorae]|uniref:YicC/YloC family endoribonuclease n=1 Tax=Algirhabdus cladophorae TaxID=3377108 RepID=UPI003B84623D